MHNPWKLATLGLVALGATVGTSTLTTAYLMRPPASLPDVVPSGVSPDGQARPAVVRVARAPQRKAAAPAAAVPTLPAPVAREAAAPAAPVVAPPAAPVVTPAVGTASPGEPSPSTPADCSAGGDRALRIAKPGALGAVLGAGLGAAGGAIASGGKGAGKGALIGGLAGAALGTGYGAYTTKNECGTILGDERSTAGARSIRNDQAQSYEAR